PSKPCSSRVEDSLSGLFILVILVVPNCSRISLKGITYSPTNQRTAACPPFSLIRKCGNNHCSASSASCENFQGGLITSKPQPFKPTGVSSGHTQISHTN